MTTTTIAAATTLHVAQATSLARRGAAALQAAWRRSQERQYLAGLDARTLRDIGVTGYDAAQEAGKWFWRV